MLHGLGRTKFSLFKIAKALRKEYQVINLGYPSRRHSIETLAELAITPALELSKDAPIVHFVTHSMGGIVLRQYLAQRHIRNLGNVVMLGPPNQGSELVDFFRQQLFLSLIFKSVNGPAGQQLGTGPADKPSELGHVAFNLGIIAGTENRNPLLNKLMNGQHDGKVSVERSKITGMTDHLVMPVDHTFMMQQQAVIHQIEHFLSHTQFDRNTTSPHDAWSPQSKYYHRTDDKSR